MTRYAFVDATVATEILPGVTFVSPITGESFPDNWLTLASQADREGKAIWPITEDGTAAAFGFTMTSITLAVVAGLPVETKVFTQMTNDQVLTLVTDKIIEVEANLSIDAFFNPPSARAGADQELQFSSVLSSRTAIQGYADEARGVISAATSWVASTSYTLGQKRKNGSHIYVVTTAGTSAASGGPTGTGTGITDGSVTWASDYAWCSRIASFSMRNIRNTVVPMDAFQIVDLCNSLTDYGRLIHFHYRDYIQAAFNAFDASDLAASKVVYDAAQVEANWFVPYA